MKANTNSYCNNIVLDNNVGTVPDVAPPSKMVTLAMGF